MHGGGRVGVRPRQRGLVERVRGHPRRRDPGVVGAVRGRQRDERRRLFQLGHDRDRLPLPGGRVHHVVRRRRDRRARDVRRQQRGGRGRVLAELPHRAGLAVHPRRLQRRLRLRPVRAAARGHWLILRAVPAHALRRGPLLPPPVPRRRPHRRLQVLAHVRGRRVGARGGRNRGRGGGSVPARVAERRLLRQHQQQAGCGLRLGRRRLLLVVVLVRQRGLPVLQRVERRVRGVPRQAGRLPLHQPRNRGGRPAALLSRRHLHALPLLRHRHTHPRCLQREDVLHTRRTGPGDGAGGVPGGGGDAVHGAVQRDGDDGAQSVVVCLGPAHRAGQPPHRGPARAARRLSPPSAQLPGQLPGHLQHPKPHTGRVDPLQVRLGGGGGQPAGVRALHGSVFGRNDWEPDSQGRHGGCHRQRRGVPAVPPCYLPGCL
mmetsp:Transcript_37693/g.88757  ORF Transcript_37693/g.88757 Transcript_37693/m.88757 type:complete len:430 (-) Transcript_37693:2461-3750(-)